MRGSPGAAAGGHGGMQAAHLHDPGTAEDLPGDGPGQPDQQPQRGGRGHHPPCDAPPTLYNLEKFRIRYLSLAEAVAIALEQGTRRPAQLALPRHRSGQPACSSPGTGVSGSDSIRVLALDPARIGAAVEQSLTKLRRLLADQHDLDDHRPAHRHHHPEHPGRRQQRRQRHPAGAGHLQLRRASSPCPLVVWPASPSTSPTPTPTCRPRQNPAYQPQLSVQLRATPVAGLRRRDQPVAGRPSRQHPQSDRLCLQPVQPAAADAGRHPHHPHPLQPAAGRVRAQRQPDAAQRRDGLLEPLRRLLDRCTAASRACASPSSRWKIVKAQYEAGRSSPPTSPRPRASTSCSAPASCRRSDQVLDNERQLRAIMGMQIEDGTPAGAERLADAGPVSARLEGGAGRGRSSSGPSCSWPARTSRRGQMNVIIAKNLLLPDLRFTATYDANSLGGAAWTAPTQLNALRNLAVEHLQRLVGRACGSPSRSATASPTPACGRRSCNLARSYLVLQDQELKVGTLPGPAISQAGPGLRAD